MKYIILFFLLSNFAHASCIDSVDNTNVYYVNGMFTNQKSYNKNMAELQKFVSNNLNGGDIDIDISSSGSWNPSEPFLQQFKQVALHKFTELNINQEIRSNIAKTFSGFNVARSSPQSAQETTDVMSAILEEIKGTYYQDQTFHHAYNSVTDLLDNCNRVVLIGHSHGSGTLYDWGSAI